jgi:hypothetical protein
VHAREHGADAVAVRRVGAIGDAAAQPVDQRRRLACSACRISPCASACGSGTGSPRARQVLHQVQVERQLLEAQALEHREHVAARSVAAK